MDEEAIIRGILNVARQNDYSRHLKIHKPNLGPYRSGNPKRCMDCGKSAVNWAGIDEPCPGEGPFACGGWQER